MPLIGPKGSAGPGLFDLFKGFVFGFGNKFPAEEKSQEAHSGVEPERVGCAEAIDEGKERDTDKEIGGPVGESAEAGANGPNAGGEDFGDHEPDDRAQADSKG